MSLANVTAGTEATAAAMNAIVADIPRTFIYGSTVPQLEVSSTASSYPGTADYAMGIDPFIGNYLLCVFQFKASAGTAEIKFDIVTSLGTDNLFTISTASTSYITPVAGGGKELDDITALAAGDHTGLGGSVGIYLKCSGGGTITVKNIRIMSGGSGTLADYLT